MIKQIIERISEVFCNRFGYEIQVHPNISSEDWEISDDQSQRLALVKHGVSERWAYSVRGRLSQICLVEIVSLKYPSEELQSAMAIELATHLEVFLQKLEVEHNQEVRRLAKEQTKGKKVGTIEPYQCFSFLFNDLGPIPAILKSRELPSHMLLVESKPMDAYRIAHEIHNMSRRWAFLTVDQSFFDTHNFESIQELGAVTLFIPNFDEFTQEQQSHLEQIIDWQPSAEQPVVIAGCIDKSADLPIINFINPQILGKLKLHNVARFSEASQAARDWQVAQGHAKEILGLDNPPAMAVGESTLGSTRVAAHLNLV